MFRSARVVAALLALVISPAALSETVAVPQRETGFLIRSEPTLVAVRESPKAKGVLLLIPGGEGRIGLKLGEPDPPSRSAFGRAFDMLRDPAQTSGSVHVAFYDNPYVLPSDATLAMRSAKDHMIRIESVVEYLRDRYKLPVWLMGHSNGGYSIAEFLSYLQDRKKEDLVAGIVFSAGRSISRFSSQANVPALFLVPEGDGCHSTDPAANRRIYEKFKAANRSTTEFGVVTGAQPQAADPCVSGAHMYNGAHEGLARALDAYLVRQLPQ